MQRAHGPTRRYLLPNSFHPPNVVKPKLTNNPTNHYRKSNTLANGARSFGGKKSPANPSKMKTPRAPKRAPMKTIVARTRLTHTPMSNLIVLPPLPYLSIRPS